MCGDDRDKAYLVDGKYAIGDLVDMGELRAVFEKFTQVTGFTVGFLDHPGLNILSSDHRKGVSFRILKSSSKGILHGNHSKIEL
jgi:hypothetical protein